MVPKTNHDDRPWDGGTSLSLHPFVDYSSEKKYFMENVFSRDMIQDNWHQCALYQFSQYHEVSKEFSLASV